MRGYTDFDDILKITESKLSGKSPLWQGDTFSDLQRWIFIDHVEPNAVVNFLAGDPSEPEALDLFRLPLDELQDLCAPQGYYELHYMYVASNYNELKSKCLTSKRNGKN